MSQTLSDSPYFVIGPFRSGSSAVARVLHEQLGVTMFIHEAPKDMFNPDGYYEDVAISNINEYLMRQKAFIKDHITYVRRHEQEVSKPWGLKDARLSYLGPVYKYLFPQANVILLNRDEDLVIKSMKRKYHWDTDHCVDHLETVKIYSKVIWGDRVFASLDMTERRTDEDISTAILEGRREL